jgi:hypothetical protein
MEMIVVMVLSGIIIAASLTFYLNYESLVRNKNKQMNSGKETLQFYQIFKHEFDNSEFVKSSGNQVVFQLPLKVEVKYEFEENFIVRLQTDQTDTFFVQANDLNIIKDKITGFDKIITMELRNYGEVFPITLVKNYSNDVMMRIWQSN